MHGEVLVTSPWGVSSRECAQFILDAHAGGVSGGHCGPSQQCWGGLHSTGNSPEARSMEIGGCNRDL